MRDLLGLARIAGTVLRLGGRYRLALWLSLAVGVGWFLFGIAGRADAGTGVAGGSGGVVVGTQLGAAVGERAGGWFHGLVIGVAILGALAGAGTVNRWAARSGNRRMQRGDTLRDGAERISVGGGAAGAGGAGVLRGVHGGEHVGRIRKLTRLRFWTAECLRCWRPFTQLHDRDALPREMCGPCARATGGE